MDTDLIMPFEHAPKINGTGTFLSAVLFASGKLVQVEDDLKVYGLVMAGYEGLSFGDDGTYTAKVASELPLERWEGVRKLERFINQGVVEIAPAYVAEHVGFITGDEASVYYRALTKQQFGEPVPNTELSWMNGSLSLG